MTAHSSSQSWLYSLARWSCPSSSSRRVRSSQVQASQITRNDRQRVKHLFLMGCNDHVLPAVQTGTGLLSREDRERLRETGIELAPAGMDLFHMELQYLYAALAQPTQGGTGASPAAGRCG